VDDPLWFGRIAAANALSDVYAMGGRPITALNLVMFPTKKLGTAMLRDILRGGQEKVSEAGASLAGGHSVDDEEPKYGLAVTGLVDPGRILTNNGVRSGDALVITKPLGTGVLFNACRSGKLPPGEMEAILPHVAALNGTALKVALDFDVHACTDITGFGLLGHALEMVQGTGVRMDFMFHEIPLYPHALEMYRKGETTGSNQPNRKMTAGVLKLSQKLNHEQQEILFDPQTSGGLLISVPEPQAERLVGSLRAAGIAAARQIGRAQDSEATAIRVL
jgi:selenide,water dikinase